ncbi:hypothetical protein DJFAAGMI_03992 [Comamonas sp. PE63]|uniref:Uncharacterized protein n=1 Tax=Comamonas brasiliensis TaxID=1812482 RepID=A0ABS5LXK0_9BURK|nr:hypothetical protein [Comamonas sp. PE63]
MIGLFALSALPLSISFPPEPGSNALSPLLQMPEAEEAFWHERYMYEPYFVPGRGFDQYYPAYLLGWQAGCYRPRQAARSFESLEPELRQHWSEHCGGSLLDWSQVRAAVKAAWRRAIAPPLTKPVAEAVLGQRAQSSLALVLQAGQRFAQSSRQFLTTADSSMAVDALRRFSQDSHKLVSELAELLGGAAVEAPPEAADDGDSGLLERVRKTWLDYLGVTVGETWLDVLRRLQTWLECAERSAQLDLPAKAAKLLKRHVMLLRGQVQALQWLSHGTA